MPAADVKLVIWDLDDTFWSGTLAEEGGVAPVEANLRLVAALARRGVLSSICSKNDEAAALAELEKLGVGRYFVFPHISFGPKGPAVAATLASMGLRAADTIFVDDNASNLAEVAQAAVGIRTMLPRDFASLDTSRWGTPDPEMRRLKEYRELATRRADEQSTFSGDNLAFLSASQIVATLVPLDRRGVDASADRVVELLNRSNQLNYTKSRMRAGVAQLAWLARGWEAAFKVYVADRYGDHGLCGFCAVKDGRLVHFAFSCRLMGMSVPQAVLAHLDRLTGRPLHGAAYAETLRATKHDWVAVRQSEACGAEPGGPDGAKGAWPVRVLNLLFCAGHAMAAFCPEAHIVEPRLPMCPPTAQQYRCNPFLFLALRQQFDVAWVAVDPMATCWLLGGLSPMFARGIAAKLVTGGELQGQPVPRLWVLGLLLRLWIWAAVWLSPPVHEQAAAVRSLLSRLPNGQRLLLFTMRDDADGLRVLKADPDSPLYYAVQTVEETAELARASTVAMKALVEQTAGVLRVVNLAPIERRYTPSGIGHYPRQFYAEAAAVLQPLLSPGQQLGPDHSLGGAGGGGDCVAGPGDGEAPAADPPGWLTLLAQVRQPLAMGLLVVGVALMLGSTLMSSTPPLVTPGLRVVGAGFGRSGTSSLQHALQRLGMKTYHATEVSPSHMRLWAAIQNEVNSKSPQGGGVTAAMDLAVDRVISDGYTATTDFPAANAYLRFLKRWPEAKVVLTVREPDRWAESFTRTLGRALPVLRRWPFSLVPDLAVSTQFCYEGAGIELDTEGRPHAAQAARAMEARTAEVRRRVPKARLLVMDFSKGDGWAELCAFLDVAEGCPQGESFPHSWLTSRANLEFAVRVGELLTSV